MLTNTVRFAQPTGNQAMLPLNQIRLKRWNSSKTLIKVLQPKKSQSSQRSQNSQRLSQRTLALSQLPDLTQEVEVLWFLKVKELRCIIQEHCWMERSSIHQETEIQHSNSLLEQVKLSNAGKKVSHN